MRRCVPCARHGDDRWGRGHALARKGDPLTVDITTGLVTNPTTGETCSGRPADPFLIEMLAAGGLIALAEQRPELFA